MNSDKSVLKLRDYDNIFRVLNSVSSSVGNTDGSACLFYNVIGSFILTHHFKKKANPVMGFAAYRVHDTTNTAITYGKLENENVISDSEAFHCWIECNDYAIDFTAPVFNESLKSIGFPHSIPQRMFQKPLSSMVPSYRHLAQEGDFHLIPNQGLTQELLQRFLSKPAPSDLANICMHWFKKAPKKIPSTFSMQNDLGEITHMQLSTSNIVSSW